MLGPVAQYSDTNDTSIVLRIDYGSTSFLLTGDMEKTAETDLDVYKRQLKYTAPVGFYQSRRAADKRKLPQSQLTPCQLPQGGSLCRKGNLFVFAKGPIPEGAVCEADWESSFFI